MESLTHWPNSPSPSPRAASNTEASVRAREAAGGGRRDRGKTSHASHAALLVKPREEAFDGASTEKTWSCAPAMGQCCYSPPGASNWRVKLNRAACYAAGWSDCAPAAAAEAAPPALSARLHTQFRTSDVSVRAEVWIVSNVCNMIDLYYKITLNNVTM